MKIKKTNLGKVLTFLFALFFCIGTTSAYAEDLSQSNSSKDVLIFEKNATQEDINYAKLRNSLIDQYGVDRAYEMLGFQKFDTNIINSNIITPDSIDPVIVQSSKPKDIYGKGKMKITIYKNYTNNTMDVWYEMTYTQDTSGTGNKTYGDMIAANFNTSHVYKTSTSYSGVIKDYVPSTSGGYGEITGNSTYARIVFTVKPYSGSGDVSNIVLSTLMQMGIRNDDLPDGFSIGISGGWFSLSATKLPNTVENLDFAY